MNILFAYLFLSPLSFLSFAFFSINYNVFFFNQVARFSAKDSRYRQAVLLRDVPWAIPLQDINSALTKQGITTGSVERWRQYIRVEVITSLAKC